MEVKLLRMLAIEVFETINELNPSFMKEQINMRKGTYWRKNDLSIPARKTLTYEDKSIKTLGPHIWNTLPEK